MVFFVELSKFGAKFFTHFQIFSPEKAQKFNFSSFKTRENLFLQSSQIFFGFFMSPKSGHFAHCAAVPRRAGIPGMATDDDELFLRLGNHSLCSVHYNDSVDEIDFCCCWQSNKKTTRYYIVYYTYKLNI